MRLHRAATLAVASGECERARRRGQRVRAALLVRAAPSNVRVAATRPFEHWPLALGRADSAAALLRLHGSLLLVVPVQPHVLEDGGDEHVAVDGLGDVVGHTRIETLLLVARHRVCGERDDRQRLGCALPRHLSLLSELRADAPRRLVTVHEWHVAVHEHCVVWLSALARCLPCLDPFDAVHRHADGMPRVIEHAAHHLDVELVVLDHEDAAHVLANHIDGDQLGRGALLSRLPLVRLNLWRARLTDEYVEEELGTAPVLGDDVDLAAHQLDELLADGEAEAHTERVLDALVADLRKEPEEVPDVLLPDADASVLDRHLQTQVVGKFRLPRGGHHDAPLRREFDRVEEEVEQHLAQPLLIAYHEDRQGVVDLDLDAHALVEGVHLDDFNGRMEYLVHVEHALFELELTRLNLGDVEDVIHQVH